MLCMKLFLLSMCTSYYTFQWGVNFSWFRFDSVLTTLLLCLSKWPSFERRSIIQNDFHCDIGESNFYLLLLLLYSCYAKIHRKCCISCMNFPRTLHILLDACEEFLPRRVYRIDLSWYRIFFFSFLTCIVLMIHKSQQQPPCFEFDYSWHLHPRHLSFFSTSFR